MHGISVTKLVSTMAKYATKRVEFWEGDGFTPLLIACGQIVRCT